MASDDLMAGARLLIAWLIHLLGGLVGYLIGSLVGIAVIEALRNYAESESL